MFDYKVCKMKCLELNGPKKRLEHFNCSKIITLFKTLLDIFVKKKVIKCPLLSPYANIDYTLQVVELISNLFKNWPIITGDQIN